MEQRDGYCYTLYADLNDPPGLGFGQYKLNSKNKPQSPENILITETRKDKLRVVCYFIMFIENKFLPGMFWSNHGKWHIDHIKPVSAFVKERITDPKIICALDNLQPLWAKDNLRKGVKY